MEYQLPRLTKMWTHLERQAGGQVKGMGEKQIEVDKRIFRTQVSHFSYKLLRDFIFYPVYLIVVLLSLEIENLSL